MYGTQTGYRRMVECPICNETLGQTAIDIHEYIVKRNAVPKDKQDLIFVPQNCVLIHRECHENSKEVDKKCLDFVLEKISAAEIAQWYWRLSDKIQGLPKGNVSLYQQENWELYIRSVL